MIYINVTKAREEFKYGKSIFDMNLRVVYYARVSTESDEQLNSLDNQKNFFEEYINNSKNWTLVNAYIDEGISGTSANKRVNFMKMIADAEKGKFDMILTKEVSRFARNTVDSIQYTDYLLKNGVVVNFLNDNLNTIDETSEFRLTIMASLAQDEVRKLSSRVKFGMARSVKDGRVLGGGNITGYYKEKGKLFIDENEAPLIRKLFDLYISGKYGFRTISQMLFDEGFHNTKGRPYAERVLARMIENPKYKGFYCGNLSHIEDYKTHKKIRHPKSEWIVFKDPNIPAIVSEEVWDRANEIHNTRTKDFYDCNAKRDWNEKRTYTGKLICKEHNCSFLRVSTGNRKNNPVWVCNEYFRGGLKRCETPNLYEKQLDEIFKEIIKKFLDNKSSIMKQILNDYLKFIKENNNEDRLNAIKVRILKLNNIKEKLLELSIDGSISNEEFRIRNETYNSELVSLEKEYLTLTKDNSDIDYYNNQIKLLESSINAKLNLDNSFRELFNIIVKKVYISKINNDRRNIKLEIIFNYDPNSLTIYKNNCKSNKSSIKYDGAVKLPPTDTIRCYSI